MDAETLELGRVARAPAEVEFREIFGVSYQRLVVQLYGVTGDAAEAEDLVQEAFVRAAAAGKRFLAVENHEAWLRTVAVNIHMRRAARIAALVAVAAVGLGFLSSCSDDDDPTSDNPGDAASETPTEPADAADFPFLNQAIQPGVYALGKPGAVLATVEVPASKGWAVWDSGMHHDVSGGSASWAFAPYEDMIIDRCNPEEHATSISGAVEQLKGLPGPVDSGPVPDSALGLTGTYLEMQIPVDVTCRNGNEPTGANLMAIWDDSLDSVSVEVWVLEDEDRLLILTKGIGGDPSTEALVQAERMVDTLQLVG